MSVSGVAEVRARRPVRVRVPCQRAASPWVVAGVPHRLFLFRNQLRSTPV
jgi:hypothetical protein